MGKSKSVAEKIIQIITGQDVTLKLNEDSSEFKVMGYNGNLKVEVIYFTGQTENDVKAKIMTRFGQEQGSPTDPSTPSYLPFVKIISRESCIKSFNLRFQGICACAYKKVCFVFFY
jgi:hypothetical protein